MESSGAQVVIPDLDDEDDFYQPQPETSTSNATSSPPRPSRGPFRGAELNYHNRNGSGTGSATSEEWDNNFTFSSTSQFATVNSNSSSNQSQNQFVNVSSTSIQSSSNTATPNPASSSSSSYRFPPGNPNQSSTTTTTTPSSFSFPRKASFASLKAAIKGQSSNNAASSGAGGNGSSGFNGASVVSPLDAFPPGMGLANFSRNDGGGYGSDYGSTGMSTSNRRGGGTTPSAVGGGGKHSRPSSPSASKFSTSNSNHNNHGRQASYFSEQSIGATSSSADSQGQGNHPPLPPFPESLPGQSYNSFQHRHQYSNSSSNAAGVNQGTSSSNFTPNLPGVNPNFNFDLKQLRGGSGGGRVSNDRDRGGLDSELALGSPFLGGGNGSGFSSIPSGKGGATGTKPTPKPSPQPYYTGGYATRRENSADEYSLDLRPMGSLEASSISDPISPDSVRGVGNHQTLGVSAEGFYSQDGAKTPTIPKSSNGDGSGNRSRVGIGTSSNDQFGMNLESQGLGTLPRGIGTIDPSTPAEYAMNVLMSRFITLAGLKVQGIMERNVNAVPNLSLQLGQGQDPIFDSLLESLAHISKKNAKPILDSLFCWRNLVLDSKVDSSMVRKSMLESSNQAGSSTSSSSVMGGSKDNLNSSSFSSNSTSNNPIQNQSANSVKDVATKLTKRKTFTTQYLLVKALIQISRQLSKNSLNENGSSALQKEVFELLRECISTSSGSSSNAVNVVGMMKDKDKDKAKISTSNLDVSSSVGTGALGMQAACFEMVSELIGELSRTHFVSVGDRFISALEQSSKARSVASSTSSASKEKEKDFEAATEAHVQAMKHLTITIFPLESFEEGAEFVEVLSRFFVASHGHRIKSAYAQTLTHLLLRVATSASAEVNHPTWLKAVDAIWPRAVAMTSKPRYWSVAFPLYVSLLTVSPEDKFSAHWFSAVETAVAKLKDRGHRNIVLNAAVRLLWVYAFRCHESTNGTAKRLDSFFRLWFPASRRHVTPAEGSHAAHVVMLHIVLFRHFDYGRDLIYDFLRSTALSGNTLSLQPDVLSRSRMTIAIKAILLTLDHYVKGEQPAFPDGADFVTSDFEESISACGDELPPDFTYPTADIGAAQDKFNDLIGKIALICEHQVSDVNVFDERIIILRGSGGAAAAAAGSLSDKALVEREGLVWRTHLKANFTVAYIRDHQPYFDLLHACFQSWPRCLSSNLSFPTVLSILFRSHFSADPSVAEASSETLRRIAKQRRGGATAVVSGFMRWIFRPETNFWEVHHDQILLLPKVEQAVSLWIEFLNFWLSELREIRADGEGPAMKGLEMERTSAWAIIDEVEAYGLLLLCSGWQPLRRQATIILKVVAALDETFLSPSRRQALAAARLAGEEEEPGRIIHLLNKPCANYCDEEDPQLTPAQQARASKWRRASNVEALSGLAESQNSVEHSLWQHVLPHFLRMCLEYFPTTVAVFRSHVTNRVPSMDQAVAHAAGTAPKMPATSGGALGTISNSSGKPQAIPSLTADQILMAEHWKLYILALCTTTTSTEGSRGAVAMGHRRQSSDSGSERVIAARDLFQKLVPFLASDQSRFRDAVITALGNINSNLYRALLETMQAVCSQLNEDWRSRSMGRSGQKKSRRHERLRTAIGHVILLTTPHLAKTSVLDDEATVQMLLGWVRDTYNFLNDREIKPDAGFNRLRRFLCGVVEQLFDGISSRGEVDKHFNFELRTKMFRTFRDWHALSQAGEEGPGRFAEMLSSAAAQFRDESQRDNALSAINRIRAEVEQLSFRAGSAMASLCQSSITELGPNDHSSTQAVEAGSLFSWLDNLFSNPSYQTHPVARRAMRALLTHNETHSALIGKAVEYSFQEPERISSGRSFFMVLADVILERSTIKVALHQAFCLALVKLGHPDGEMRRKAFAMLDHVARSQQPDLALNDLEVGVGSPLPAIYLRAQRDVSMYLAKSFRPIRAAMLSEYTARLPVIDRARRATTLGLLPEWIRGHDLLERGSLDGEVEQQKQRQQPPQFGGGGNQGEPLYSTHLILTNLLFLTIKYSDEHNFEIQEMWASLANSEDLILNANVIIKFLVEQTLKHRSPAFVVNAKRVVSCLSNTVIGPHMFDELCSLIEPGSMIPVPHEGDFNSVDAALRDLHLADLERALPTVSRKHAFSPGQLALFFVGELTYERSEQLGSHLPVLLHSIFMQIDSSSPFVQEQATSIFEQMMRSLVSGASSSAGLTSNEEKDSDAGKQENGARGGKTKVEQLLGRGMAIWWTNESAGAELDETRTPRSMRSTLSEILTILEPLYPDLRERWGTVALLWATSNPVRHLACRSFQAFRVLLPATNPSMLANMLGRLSNTVSDPSPDIQSFALEILHTFKAVIKAADPSQQELFCQTFWATVACLSTINENEFAEAIAMLNSLLDKVDIGSTEVIEMLKIKCPEGWEGEPGGIQPLVLRGLKSSVTSDASFSILNRLSQIKNPALIDSTDGRIAFLFVAALPWFLQSTDQPIEDRDETIFALADNVAALAEEVGKKDLNRVATSIAKSRFRTKDDLIRQAVGCVRSNYLPSLGPELVVLLLGLTLNEKDWMRKQTMQVLKIFFQVIDTRSEAFANLGSELLMPLLRLLSTPLSSQALEVLDEPITITGGPAANQILRMSLQWGNKGNKFNSNQRREQASDASIFGAPDDSGWAVAHPQDLTTRTRINVQAVFKTCELTLDVTPIDSNVNFVVDDDYEMDQDQPDFDFLPDERSFRGENEGDETASVGDLVNQLHDLSSFFVDEPSNSSARPPQSASTTGFEYEASQTSIVAKILGNSSFSPAGSSSRGGTESPVSRRPFDLDLERPSLSRKGTAELNLSSQSSKEEGGSSENDSGNGKGRSKEVGGWGRRSMFKMGGSNRRDSLQSHAKSAGSNMKHQG